MNAAHPTSNSQKTNRTSMPSRRPFAGNFGTSSVLVEAFYGQLSQLWDRIRQLSHIAALPRLELGSWGESYDETTLPTHPARESTSLSIPDNFDPDSNSTTESDWHSAKHPSPKLSTDAGITI
jgi:hypothetical protein